MRVYRLVPFYKLQSRFQALKLLVLLLIVIIPISNGFTSSIRTYLRPFTQMTRNSNSKRNVSQNGIIMDHSQSTEKQTSRAITPNHILHPYYFTFNATDNRTFQNAIEPLSFPVALEKLTRSIEEIISLASSSETSPNHNETSKILLLNRILGCGFLDNTMDPSSISSSKQNYYTIQINQKLSHKVDGLCWLHANEKMVRSLSPPMIYFEKAEHDFESATIGSALTITDFNDDYYWNLIDGLPDGSGVYGGKRFDVEGEASEEWKQFGKEMWILPSIELRSETMGASPHDTVLPFMNGDSHDATNHSVNGDSVLKPSHNQKATMTTNLMIHLHFDSIDSLLEQAHAVLHLLQRLTSTVSPKVPSTTLPPILTRGYNNDAQETFENGVNEAIRMFESKQSSTDRETPLEKVVLARRADLHFGAELNGLDIMKKLKFGGTGGHLYYLNPGYLSGQEFLGCSPEQLFQVRNVDRILSSEALAGTRPRGSTSEADIDLFRDLMSSHKDRNENGITAHFIRQTFNSLYDEGVLQNKITPDSEQKGDTLFIRRLRHLQHLCKSFQSQLSDGVRISEVTKKMMERLNPTPAVCGYPQKSSLDFIKKYERVSFDRGFYAGPFGFIGSSKSDVIVAIRSGLLQRRMDDTASTLSVYAGAGIVPGSTVQSEWSETGLKLGVLSSVFSQSPLTLKSFVNPNEAWATAFVEELIRSGVTQFYVCPGSRSTPLTTALARAMRVYVGIIDCISVHDERGAAFRALGYARGTKRVAAVITSSGTAVANLYPAVVEAGMDGVPILILSADRPYENRHTGANQAIDQLKIFSESYVRWFHDISPPSDDIPITAALSDANHAVNVAKSLHGPVHLNIQFRENLAPEAGPIRGDNRAGSITEFSTSRFTDVPGFDRWSKKGGMWTKVYSSYSKNSDAALHEVANLISKSKRGMIVVGNVRTDEVEGEAANGYSLSSIIMDLADSTGMPIFAGAQSAQLRFYGAQVVPYAEHLLKNSELKSSLKPDLIIQVGSHIVSTEVQSLISDSVKHDSKCSHVLLNVPSPAERVDATGTITHNIECDLYSFIPELTSKMGRFESRSELISLVLLGKKLAAQIPNIIHNASQKVLEEKKKVWENAGNLGKDVISLSEPQIILAISEVLYSKEGSMRSNLFLSNSMPVRDAEFFLYPSRYDSLTVYKPFSVAVNRGASGIDGIISTAVGFTEATKEATTLLIGDLATLHDLNSFHNLSHKSKTSSSLPLTTVIVNNDGGAIFSFLPIAKHANDVNFEEFWGTPTNSFSFQKGAEAFGIPYTRAHSFTEFLQLYERSFGGEPSIIEAQVVDRNMNVRVHHEISVATNNFLHEMISTFRSDSVNSMIHQRLPIRIYRKNEELGSSEKTLVLIHGWMGDKDEWNEVAQILMEDLSEDWTIYSIDLPGHGKSPRLQSDENYNLYSILKSAGDDEIMSALDITIDDIARAVIQSLSEDHLIKSIDAVAGYSLGGRVALAMKKVTGKNCPNLLNNDTKMILLGSDPGIFKTDNASQIMKRKIERQRRDSDLENMILQKFQLAELHFDSQAKTGLYWDSFLSKWYGNKQLWGNLQMRLPYTYCDLIQKRADSLSNRAPDIALMLRICSPGRNIDAYWVYCNPSNTHVLSGGLDEKYTQIFSEWKERTEGLLHTHILEGAGHALLLENPSEVASIIKNILFDKQNLKEGITSDPKSDSMLMNGKQMEEVASSSRTIAHIALMDSEEFRVELVDGSAGKGVSGVGWGEFSAASNTLNERRGLMISISSADNSVVGLGEVSPMKGVHSESFNDVKIQLEAIQQALSGKRLSLPPVLCEDVLSLDGSLMKYLQEILVILRQDGNFPYESFLASVSSGLEMAILSFAAHSVRLPLPQALRNFHNRSLPLENVVSIALNGLETRKSSSAFLDDQSGIYDGIKYHTIKVKVGHRGINDDVNAISSISSSKKRLDANRAWDFETSVDFAARLKGASVIGEIEFIEEPIRKVTLTEGKWSLERQIYYLEKWHSATGIYYALDESVAEALSESENSKDLSNIGSLLHSTKGCAAIVLKPSLIGLERSVILSNIAHEAGIGAVFTSTFDTGVGLSFISFVAGLSDALGKGKSKMYSHGLSTFSTLRGDTLTPPFGSYVNSEGTLNLASLGRSLYGLGLDEIRDYIGILDDVKDFSKEDFHQFDEKFQSISSTSDTGREISLQVSLVLPFSREIACNRFTDLPQQPRWSPWLNSVAYVDKEETEWTLNVRGVEFRWKAVSKMLEDPKGIMWESVSGLKNKGVVEFIKISEDSCLMRVKMTIITPRVIALVFKTTGEFVKDFVENKLLKWSLESFRDVVKADLALERGDAELGDALLGAIEGRANAIEATLSYQSFDEASSS